MRATTGRWERVYAAVRRIPRGRVATYGQIARLAGLGRQARQVGYALHALPWEGLAPWHRVVNARGAISLPPAGGADLTQRMRLEREGVRFDARGRLDLERYGWRPGARAKPPGVRPASRRRATAASSPAVPAAASPRSATPRAGGRGRPSR
jgi:methylated-DNA-protein-cysteine methyltransferase related protein